MSRHQRRRNEASIRQQAALNDVILGYRLASRHRMVGKTPGNYNTWVMSRLVEERGESIGTVSDWIIDRWIEQNKKHLDDEYGITRNEYRASKGLKQRGISWLSRPKGD